MPIEPAAEGTIVNRCWRSATITVACVLACLTVVLPAYPATQATTYDGTAFDGTYQGNESLKISAPGFSQSTPSVPVAFSVSHGAITGGLNGLIIDSSGTARVTIPVPGYGAIVMVFHFVRNASAVEVEGTISGNLSTSADQIHLAGTLHAVRGSGSGASAAGATKSKKATKPMLTITSLPTAHAGSPYPNFSFCQPQPTGAICGGHFQKVTNPSGDAEASYTFFISNSLDAHFKRPPKGLILSFNGKLAGTVDKSVKPGTYPFTVCARASGLGNPSARTTCHQTQIVVK